MVFLVMNFAVKNGMFNLNENNRIVMSRNPSDMRIGVNGMCGLVRAAGLEPANGDVYIFVGKSRKVMKKAAVTYEELLAKTPHYRMRMQHCRMQTPHCALRRKTRHSVWLIWREYSMAPKAIACCQRFPRISPDCLTCCSMRKWQKRLRR